MSTQEKKPSTTKSKKQNKETTDATISPVPQVPSSSAAVPPVETEAEGRGPSGREAEGRGHKKHEHHKHKNRLSKDKLYTDFHENLVAIVDAKNQFNKRLEKIISKHIHNELINMFKEAKTTTEETNQPDQILIEFQKLLRGVTKWSSGQIYDFYETIKSDPDCKNVEDILRASCIGTLKVLSSLRTRPLHKNEKINLVIPEIKSFIYKCLGSTAKDLFANPYFFNPNVSREKYYKNQQYVRDMIRRCIADNIIDALPIDNILNDYIKSYETKTSQIVNDKKEEENIKDELAKEGYYSQTDHWFFSDSDIDTDESDNDDKNDKNEAASDDKSDAASDKSDATSEAVSDVEDTDVDSEDDKDNDAKKEEDDNKDDNKKDDKDDDDNASASEKEDEDSNKVISLPKKDIKQIIKPKPKQQIKKKNVKFNKK